jgi:hypothetical protein
MQRLLAEDRQDATNAHRTRVGDPGPSCGLLGPSIKGSRVALAKGAGGSRARRAAASTLSAHCRLPARL